VVAHAAPDGYTVLLTISGNAINATLYTHLNFDFARDLTPVAAIGRTPFVIVVNPTFRIRSVPELIEYAKANPGKINIASAGPGTGPHVACELFKMMTGVDMVQVPYKASYMTDHLGGQIPIAFSPIAQIIQDVRAGKLIAIGVTTPTRSDAAPEIPAIAEFIPGYAASGWYGICAPTGTPNDVIEKLNAATTACVTDANLKSRLLNLGVETDANVGCNFQKVRCRRNREVCKSYPICWHQGGIKRVGLLTTRALTLLYCTRSH